MDNRDKHSLYYITDKIAEFQFYRLPKQLIQSLDYIALPMDAKVLYSFMLDRTFLSMDNKWIDEHGAVYIYFTVEDAARRLGVSKSKISRLLEMLDDKRGYGLIKRKRQGQGKPDMIYVKKLIDDPAVIHNSKEFKEVSDSDISNCNF